MSIISPDLARLSNSTALAHKRSAPKLAALLFSAWLISLRYPSLSATVSLTNLLW
ncbi:Uncharacterised protein [Vibrio cholerae]|nr:Uncharacterised protein [Vibrio cholerae]